jgi:NAD(P)-dependent dehydrogenase (short-subunit alcohol dehydrogenase family)
MAKIFITGSADGLGSLTAQQLIKDGHQVVLHARNQERAEEAMGKAPGATSALAGDLSDIEETKKLAKDVNALGCFDAIIHNAGIYRAPNKTIFAVNSLAPYILTCLVEKPERLIYLSSGMHLSGNPRIDPPGDTASYNYSDSKLHVLMLCKAVARLWPDVYSNAINPGWVPTKMGGAGAPDSLGKGYQTQVWLATSNDPAAKVSGRYFFHRNEARSLPKADDVELQEQFLQLCEKASGVALDVG